MIPLSVIGGFLGAGKTTLVNHILRTAPRRFAVLVNDFGAINVDAALIASQDSDTMALTNGCVCCSLGDDFGDALSRLAARIPAPEHILVEASGVSDPWRIAQLALIEPDLDLMPLIVLIDAASLAAQLADPFIADTITRQIVFAELLVLNKIDLAPDPAGIAATLTAMRPEARQITAINAVIPGDAWHFVPPPRAPASRLTADTPHLFPTWHIPCASALDRSKLRAVLADLPRSVLRVKGFCRLGESAEPYLLQYAAERWSFSPAPGAISFGLVFIGTGDMPVGADLERRFKQAVLF